MHPSRDEVALHISAELYSDASVEVGGVVCVPSGCADQNGSVKDAAGPNLAAEMLLLSAVALPSSVGPGFRAPLARRAVAVALRGGVAAPTAAAAVANAAKTANIDAARLALLQTDRPGQQTSSQHNKHYPM